LELATRAVENKLWAHGVRIHSPKGFAACYNASRRADPDLSALRILLTQMVDRYRQKKEVEMQLLGLYKETMALESVRDRVQRQLDEIGAGQL